KRRAHLREHLVELLEGKPLPLDGVPGAARPEAERVAPGVEALAPRSERAEGVRILGDLAQHRRGRYRGQAALVSSRPCSTRSATPRRDAVPSRGQTPQRDCHTFRETVGAEPKAGEEDMSDAVTEV